MCRNCGLAVSAYGRLRQEGRSPYCGRCHLPIALDRGQPTHAWEIGDGSCLLLSGERLNPPDFRNWQRRESLIAQIGRGAAASLGIDSSQLPHGLVPLLRAEGHCAHCGKTTPVACLTRWQTAHCFCPCSAAVLSLFGLHTEPSAMEDSGQCWPVQTQHLEVIWPTDRFAETSNMLSSGMNDLDLELLGLK
jgi:hypothetical protein